MEWHRDGLAEMCVETQGKGEERIRTGRKGVVTEERRSARKGDEELRIG